MNIEKKYQNNKLESGLVMDMFRLHAEESRMS